MKQFMSVSTCFLPLEGSFGSSPIMASKIVRIRSPKSLKASLRQVWRRWLLPNLRAGVEGVPVSVDRMAFGLSVFFFFFWGEYNICSRDHSLIRRDEQQRSHT